MAISKKIYKSVDAKKILSDYRKATGKKRAKGPNSQYAKGFKEGMRSPGEHISAARGPAQAAGRKAGAAANAAKHKAALEKKRKASLAKDPTPGRRAPGR